MPLARVPVGGPAPAFTAVDTRGGSHSLADYAGKWVVLEWFNHGCPYTKKHYALMNGIGNSQAMQQEYTKRGVIWPSIVSSGPGRQGYTSAAKADDEARKKGAAPTAIIRDTAGVLGRLYGARNTPQYAIIDPEGVLRYGGAIDDRRTSSPKGPRRARLGPGGPTDRGRSDAALRLRSEVLIDVAGQAPVADVARR